MNLEELQAEYLPVLINYGTKAIVAALIILFGYWIAKSVSNKVSKGMEDKKVDATVSRFIGKLLFSILFILVVLAALSQIGIQVTSFIAILGAAGLAVGLALQGSLSNFASGVLLVLFRPIKAGDFVEAGGVAGSVKEISIFSTVLGTGDNKVVIVPNSSVMSGPITNYSTMPTRRVDMVVGISYDADIRLAKQILEQLANEDERVLKDPAVTIAVAELADSSVNLVFRPWVNSGDFWPVKFSMTERIKLAFDEAGIGIPYPQMDIHMPSKDS